MADAQKTIDLIFNGIDKTGAATLSALDNARKFTSSVKDITQPIADFTIGAVKLEAGLLSAGVAMAAFSIHSAGEFDTAFRQISTLFDASVEDVAKFKNAILDYSKTSGKSLEDITNSIASAVGSGVKWSDSLALIGTAEKLAISTRADLKSTTDVLVSTMNVYGMKTEDAGKVADVFFQIVKDGKIEMKDLAASFSMVSPIAQAAGVSFEEVGAAIAVLTAQGVAPSTAIEYLRSALSNIIKPSKDAAGLAAELGIQFDATALRSKGLAGVLADVSTATKGSADQVSRLIGDAGGFVAVSILAKDGAQKLKDELVLMGNATGAVAAAFAKMTDSFDVSNTKIANAFRALTIEIGTPLLNEFGGIAAAIAAIFNALGASVKNGSLGSLVAYVEGLMGDLQRTLETVAKNLPAALESADFSGFKKGIASVLAAMKDLFGNIDITTVDGLKTAIETVGAAFFGLSKYVSGVIESFKPLFDTLVAVGKGAKDVDLSFLEFAGNMGGIATQLNVVLPLLSGLLGLMTIKSGLGLLSEFKGLVSILPSLATALTGAGVAVATYFATDKVIELAKALAQWKSANDKLSDSQEQGAAINTRAGLSLERFAETTGIAAKSVDEAIKLIDEGAVVWSTAASGWVKVGDAMADTADAAKDTVNPFKMSNDAMLENANIAEKAAGIAKGVAAGYKEISSYALKTVPIFDALTGKITGYEQQLVKTEGGTIKLGGATDKAGTSLSKVAKETEKAEEATRKWNEEVAKMAFEEKLKLIDSQTKITTANIEANSKIAVAALDSLSKSIESSSNVLSTLFGSMKDFGSMDWSAIRLVEKQIDTENKFRQDAADLQKRLIEQQIAQMKAQTDALIKGDGLIKIDGAGLAPHLEAFMWEVLRAIQVKVNKDGLKMLLGA